MLKEVVNLDFVIIGGGIVGLSIAKTLIEKYPNAEISVLEQEQYLGEHTSGRNSGVLHAGIYYPYRSLKHLLCLRGNELWDSWAPSLNIQHARMGKWIVAKNQTEQDSLEKIWEQANKNEVPHMRRASKSDVTKLSEIVHCHDAIFSPRTGIIDQSQALLNLRSYLESKNVNVMLKSKAIKLQKNDCEFNVELDDYAINTKTLINCAGLHAIELRNMIGLKNYQNYYVKGCYLKTTQTKITDQLIYPVPLKNLKGLGVHLTLDFDNSMKFGPNTIDTDKIDYAVDDSILPDMNQAINGFFKTIDTSRVYVDYSGIRPKIKNSNNELVADFIIDSPIQNYWEFLGIESPGFTAAPAIAEYFISKI